MAEKKIRQRKLNQTQKKMITQKQKMKMTRKEIEGE